MTLHCTSRHTDGTTCQEQDPRHAVHHAHDMTGANCRQWVDAGGTTTRIPGECDWLPVDKIERRGNEAAAKLKARRERILAAAVEDPDNEVLRARAKRLRHREARANGGPGLYPPREQFIADDHTPDWRMVNHAQALLGAQDENAAAAVHQLAAQNTARGVEIERLRVELAKSRRDALFEASEIAGTVQADTSADKALRATIVAKLRVAAMADDKCAKCQHRRGDHQHNGGVCNVRRSATTHCACRQHGFATATEEPKGD